MEPDVLQLVPVCSGYFAHRVVDEVCEVQQFCTQNRLISKVVFLNVEYLPEEMRDQSPRDVILMDKVE